MKITYIHHSCFLVETDRFYYLFDYEKGALPRMKTEKPVLVLSSHSHHDHYNPEIFPILKGIGMQDIRAVLSDDIEPPKDVNALMVSPGKEYLSAPMQKIITLRSTDLGVAFLIEDESEIIYHAGDLNDWVWDEESDSYNEQMTADYREQIAILSEKLASREADVSFVVLDPRQEKDYARGLHFFLENIPSKKVYPMHYCGKPDIIDSFLKEYPQYESKIQKSE